MVAKTPLPESFVKVISPKQPWTVKSMIDKAKSLYEGKTSMRYLAINASASNETDKGEDWQGSNIP
jgi:hypothetical protein